MALHLHPAIVQTLTSPKSRRRIAQESASAPRAPLHHNIQLFLTREGAVSKSHLAAHHGVEDV